MTEETLYSPKEFVKELNYSKVKPTAVESRPVINRYRANNQSHTANQWIEIEIQTGTPGLHLFPHDSFLEGVIDVVTTGNTGRIDGNCFSLFRTLEVIVGGQLMERTSFCGKTWHVLNDIILSQQQRQYQTVSHAGNGITGSSAAGEKKIPFAFTLPSALLGSLSTKALPLSKLQNSSVVLRLELDNQNNWLGDAGTAITITSTAVKDVYYNAKCSMLPSDVESDLFAATGGRILLPAMSYNGEYKQINTLSTTFNDKFSFQYDSLNAILFWFMPTGGQNLTTHQSQTGRVNATMHEYQLDINGDRYPSSGPVGDSSDSVLSQARFITELRRTFDMLGTTESGGVMTSDRYASDDGTTALVVDNAANPTTSLRNVYGLDLNRFNGSHESMFAGINTRGQQISLNCKFASTTPNSLYIYAVAMFDVLYIIEGGLMTARY